MEQPRPQVTHFRNSSFKVLNTKWKDWKFRKNLCEIFYEHEQILLTRNFRRKFIKNLLPEKRKKNM